MKRIEIMIMLTKRDINGISNANIALSDIFIVRVFHSLVQDRHASINLIVMND